MGPVHGIAFLYYTWTIASTVTGEAGTRTEILQLLGCAVLPFGAWLSIALIRRKLRILAEAAQ